MSAYTYDSERDAGRRYSSREFLPYGVLESNQDQYGVPEILRYAINQMLTKTHIEMHRHARRILAFRIEFDARIYEFAGHELNITVLSEPAFKDEP